ncbi:hypothetical protein GWK47_008002 [Chionoecetes opilio]|uniref:Uncharacterized protein n=1 Tax=Chionoecetes opilio TaxID=41210 RepID=A0A8J4Y6E6_CHIOP|nr:hypothetical protein GWK47_008002 [Chionoecetes opilio]
MKLKSLSLQEKVKVLARMDAEYYVCGRMPDQRLHRQHQLGDSQLKLKLHTESWGCPGAVTGVLVTCGAVTGMLVTCGAVTGVLVTCGAVTGVLVTSKCCCGRGASLTTTTKTRRHVRDNIPYTTGFKVLLLRSIDNVNIVLTMVKNFSFPDHREQCFEQLYKFAEKPDWRKGMRVWKEVFSYPAEPIGRVFPLENEYCQPRPDIDLKRMKLSSPILENLPEGVVPEHLRHVRGLSPLDVSPEQKGLWLKM